MISSNGPINSILYTLYSLNNFQTAKDWENFNRKVLAFLRLASIRLMLRKLCNQR